MYLQGVGLGGGGEGDGCRDGIDLAHDRNRWRGHVNVVMRLRVP